MRSMMFLTAAASLISAPIGGAAPLGVVASEPQQSRAGLCRRAAPLPALPPERSRGNDQRWERRSGEAMPEMAMTAPPPPPPPAPAPMAPPAPGVPTAPPPPAAVAAPAPSAGEVAAPAPSAGEVAAPAPSAGEVVVTGSRTARSRPDGIVADDIGRFPDRASPIPEPRYQPRPRSGLLTAGDHDDLLNPELYARYVDGFLRSETLDGVPRVDTRRVLTIAVQDNSGRPVPFAPVTLTCSDGNTLTLPTLADGTVAFFPDFDRLGRAVRVATTRGVGRMVTLGGAPGAIRQTLTVAAPAAPVRRFDLALVIDTTGSMTDELDYLKAELRSILARLTQSHPGLDIRVALIPYRDQGDEYVTRTFAFTPDISALQRNLAAQNAGGGGDYPEAMEQAMARAVALQWRPDAVKSLVLVADAPPHADDVAATWRATEAARARRIQIVPVAASGVGEGAEYIMRAMAAATQSRYLFLTDDSGIGNPHAPPAIDCYLVTRLDALLRRVLDGQISGRRVEPDRQEVIRSVGDYQGGKCVLPPDFGQR